DLEDALEVIKTEVYLDEDVDLEVVPHEEETTENIEKEETSEENIDTENETDEVESNDEETTENEEVASESEKAEEETTDETVESEQQENTEKDSETEEDLEKDNTEVESEESMDKNTIDTINVEVDEEQSIVSWHVEESSNDLKDKTVGTEKEVTLPEDAELNEELVDGDNYIIPNVAKGTINDDELESNEVRTLVEKEPEEVPPAETPEEPKQPENP